MNFGLIIASVLGVASKQLYIKTDEEEYTTLHDYFFTDAIENIVKEITK